MPFQILTIQRSSLQTWSSRKSLRTALSAGMHSEADCRPDGLDFLQEGSCYVVRAIVAFYPVICSFLAISASVPMLRANGDVFVLFSSFPLHSLLRTWCLLFC